MSHTSIVVFPVPDISIMVYWSPLTIVLCDLGLIDLPPLHWPCSTLLNTAAQISRISFRLQICDFSGYWSYIKVKWNMFLQHHWPMTSNSCQISQISIIFHIIPHPFQHALAQISLFMAGSSNCILVVTAMEWFLSSFPQSGKKKKLLLQSTYYKSSLKIVIEVWLTGISRIRQSQISKLFEVRYESKQC